MMRSPSTKIPTVVLFLESARASGRSLLRGIAEYARHHGPWAFCWEPGGFENAVRRLKSIDADGIILRDVEGLDEVLRLRKPTIVVGHSQREVPGVSNVLTDSQAIARLAAEHLIDNGFTQFGFAGYDGIPWSDERRDAFAGFVREAGHRTEIFDSSEYDSSGKPRRGESETIMMARWLGQLPLPIGVMACNDDRAENVIEACKIAGLRVPDDVGIVGADNDDLLCELAHPPLSSVAMNFERAGFECAQLLHQMMQRPGKPKARNIAVAPTYVVPRQSTDILFIDDLAVSRAVRFIRQNARKQVAVDDVVAAVNLSRRVLEKRFRSALGRSVLHEIKRSRVDQICRMLVETNHSISEIAEATGFAGVEHFARYFRQEKRVTPLGYRRSHGKK